MNRNDLQTISKIREKEARILLRNQCALGAYYLLGYSVECAIKACISKQIRRYEFPDRKLANESYSLGCLKVAAEAQFSCPQFGPHAHRPISYLGTLLAFEVHDTPDSSILAIMI
jgi:hypothetical protein